MPKPTGTKFFRTFPDIFTKIFRAILSTDLSKNAFQSFVTSLESFPEFNQNFSRVFSRLFPRIQTEFLESLPTKTFVIFAKNYFPIIFSDVYFLNFWEIPCSVLQLAGQCRAVCMRWSIWQYKNH